MLTLVRTVLLAAVAVAANVLRTRPADGKAAAAVFAYHGEAPELGNGDNWPTLTPPGWRASCGTADFFRF
jgi:hypothetical protein